MGRFYDCTASVVRFFYDRRIATPPVLEPTVYFKSAENFVNAFEEIQQEALAVAAQLNNVPRFHELMPEQESISANDGRDWRMFILKAYGVENAGKMAACPRLAALVRKHPEVVSASFSFLGPNKYIPAHRGPFRGVLRFFLMLSMPCGPDGTPQAVLRVADQEYRLQDGDSLLWDDTYEHEAWNESQTVRIVLSLDIHRPFMTWDTALLSRLLMWIVRVSMARRQFNTT